MKDKAFFNEVKAMTKADLIEKLRTLSEELMKLRFKNTAGQLNQGHLVKEVRRNIARVRTALRAQG